MPDVNSHRGGSWVETTRERDMPVKYARLNRALYRRTTFEVGRTAGRGGVNLTMGTLSMQPWAMTPNTHPISSPPALSLRL